MIVFVLMFICVCCYKMKVPSQGLKSYHDDYLSIEKTNSIKGIFTLVVFFSHFSGYIEYSTLDNYATFPFRFIRQALVTMFLLYSGYGIMESIKKKGIVYVKTIPAARLGQVLFRFDIAILLFLIMDLCIGREITVSQFVWSLIGWKAIGNSNWYIFTILLLYLITYITFIIFKDRKEYKVSCFVLLGIIVIYCIIFHIFQFQNEKSYLYYMTILCYPLGMLYSIFKEDIENFLKKNNFNYFAVLAFVIVGTAVTRFYSHAAVIIEMIYMLFFSLFILLITMKISFNNKILQWIGTHLFEIYILQRIPMTVFAKCNLNKNIYLFFPLCFIATMLFAAVYKVCLDKLWKQIRTAKKQG